MKLKSLLIIALFSTKFALAEEPAKPVAATEAPWRGPSPVIGKEWPSEGHFFRRYWFQMGEGHINPAVNDRFRVNDPYVATHPKYHSRLEPKGNGMMQIPFNEVIREIDAARIYLELWGGHPHTSNRRFTINGRSAYAIPAPVEEQCCHIYRYEQLNLTDLVQGYNAIQFNVDGDNTFWGHFIVEEAGLDALLKSADVEVQSLSSIANPKLLIAEATSKESIACRLNVPSDIAARIASVSYVAHYDGYDENGDGVTQDWHGMTKRKVPIGHIGTSTQSPFEVSWDVSMFPAQDNVSIRALVEFKPTDSSINQPAGPDASRAATRYFRSQDLFYQTDAVDGLSIEHPEGIEVAIISAANQSVPFWSRAERLKTCDLALGDIDAKSIERAALHIAIWDGGAGEVKEYFKFNGRFIPIAADAKHDVMLSQTELGIDQLQATNKIELFSDTEHHGIEVLHPGPALAIRYKK
jgi:hypothetical protein